MHIKMGKILLSATAVFQCTEGMLATTNGRPTSDFNVYKLKMNPAKGSSKLNIFRNDQNPALANIKQLQQKPVSGEVRRPSNFMYATADKKKKNTRSSKSLRIEASQSIPTPESDKRHSIARLRKICHREVPMMVTGQAIPTWLPPLNENCNENRVPIGRSFQASRSPNHFQSQRPSIQTQLHRPSQLQITRAFTEIEKPKPVRTSLKVKYGEQFEEVEIDLDSSVSDLLMLTRTKFRLADDKYELFKNGDKLERDPRVETLLLNNDINELEIKNVENDFFKRLKSQRPSAVRCLKPIHLSNNLSTLIQAERISLKVKYEDQVAHVEVNATDALASVVEDAKRAFNIKGSYKLFRNGQKLTKQDNLVDEELDLQLVTRSWPKRVPEGTTREVISYYDVDNVRYLKEPMVVEGPFAPVSSPQHQKLATQGLGAINFKVALHRHTEKDESEKDANDSDDSDSLKFNDDPEISEKGRIMASHYYTDYIQRHRNSKFVKEFGWVVFIGPLRRHLQTAAQIIQAQRKLGLTHKIYIVVMNDLSENTSSRIEEPVSDEKYDEMIAEELKKSELSSDHPEVSFIKAPRRLSKIHKDAGNSRFTLQKMEEKITIYHIMQAFLQPRTENDVDFQQFNSFVQGMLKASTATEEFVADCVSSLNRMRRLFGMNYIPKMNDIPENQSIVDTGAFSSGMPDQELNQTTVLLQGGELQGVWHITKPAARIKQMDIHAVKHLPGYKVAK